MGAARRLRKARQLKKKMVDAGRGLANLFEKRIYELRGAPFLFKTGEGHRPVSADVSQSIIESWEGMWLRSIAQLDEIWNGGLMGIEECFEDLGLMGYGSDLIILFFNIFHTYQIVTHKRLACFLNEENRGRLIFSYSVSRFSSTRWHLSLRDTYRNLNLRLSLQESRSTKNLAGLLKLLGWDTWGSIEFDYLATELSQTTYDRSLPQDLRAMKATFLEFAGSPSQDKLSVAELEGLLRRLVTYISEELPHQMLGSHSSDFIEFKLLYDMFSFIVRYHTHILSEGLLKEIQQSSKFDRICAFEQAVGLLSNALYSLHVRRCEFEKYLVEAKNSHYLIDSNQKRSYTIFEVEDMEAIDLDHFFEAQGSVKDELNEFHSRVASNLPRICGNQCPEIDSSIKQLSTQFQVYLLRLNRITAQNNPENSQFLRFIQSFKDKAVDLVQKDEKYYQEWFAMLNK
ncbi:hypothetical protein PGT21_012104 [Puccinia graminis f. sp. tritici]|uniref:Uncharacterized protein n=1 Tax=Puccinia graminis f. sp. tritici TaxID=56615 RepID=A0A5B0P6Y5_PUCGR|nr:hypothetical protein PGTUg99_007895 [Puccinia graminis f. sp. tritici]KAA1105575.1 hypothetical protein PGT21_012104 [Puccinia graminis f. sp. tritici]